MRLTKYDKEAFVRAVMNDIPYIDYTEIIRNKVLDASASKLPPAAQALVSSATTCHLIRRDRNDYAARDERNCAYMWCDIYPTEGWETDAFEAEIRELVNKAREQDAAREHMEAQLTGLINSCSTLKKAHKTLPEFIKYLPQDRDGTGVGDLPAIANIVADLSKMGWQQPQTST